MRWPALAVFSAGLSLVNAARFIRAVRESAQLGLAAGLLLLPPTVVTVGLLWTIAIVRALRRRRSVFVSTVLGVAATIGLSFGLFIAESLVLTGSLDGSHALVDLLLYSIDVLLFPLYVVAGIDLAELFGAGAQFLASAPQRVIGVRPGLIAGALAGVAALVLDGFLRRAELQEPAFLLVLLSHALYTTLWVLATVGFLRLIHLRTGRIEEPTFAILLSLAIGAYLVSWPFVSLSLPGDASASFVVLGTLSLLASAVLVARRGAKSRSYVLLLGLVGLWLVFLYLPPAISSYLPPAIRGSAVANTGIRGLLDAVAFSGLALVVVSLAAERRPALATVRAVGTASTLTLVLIVAYVQLVLVRQEAVPDGVSVLQVALLVAILALALESLPVGWRLGGAAVLLAGLLVSVGFTLTGSPSRMVALAQAVVLAVALAWDALMSGKRVTNREGRLWPRPARVSAYTGYVLVGGRVRVVLEK